MLTQRKRGRFYHVRGTVRVGSETRIVKEHSSGCDRLSDAKAYASNLERQIRDDILYGRDGRAQRMTIDEAALIYVRRPGGVARGDLHRIAEFERLIGSYNVMQAKLAWGEFLQKRCVGLAPATADRFRAVLQAILNHAADTSGFEAPKLTPIRFKNERIRYLSIDEQNRLLASYAPHVRPIATTLCFQGMRTGEALTMDWRQVRWSSNELYLPETKIDEERTVSMQEPVRKALHELWVKRGSPSTGRVFLNRLGKPYSDPRDYKLPGGNPIRQPHNTACRRAGIEDFTPHDWRHHWASWCVMSGIDLETIRYEGGWSSLRMVQRYARVSAEHRVEAMKKLKTLGN